MDIVDISLGGQLAARPTICVRGGFSVVEDGMALVPTATAPARLSIIVLNPPAASGTRATSLALLAVITQALVWRCVVRELVIIIAQVIVAHQAGSGIAHMQVVIAQVQGIRIDYGRMVLAGMAGHRIDELHIRRGEILRQVDLGRLELGQRLLGGGFRLDNREANIRRPTARRGIWEWIIMENENKSTVRKCYKDVRKGVQIFLKIIGERELNLDI